MCYVRVNEIGVNKEVGYVRLMRQLVYKGLIMRWAM